MIDHSQKKSLLPNCSLAGPAVPDGNHPTNVAAILYHNGYHQVDHINMSLIPFRIHIEIPKMDRNTDIRCGIQNFVKVLKEVDIFAWFLLTMVRTNFHRSSDIPLNSSVKEILKHVNSEWRGRRDMCIYLNVHSSSTALEIKKGCTFGETKNAGIRAWRDVCHTDSFQKIGWLSYIRPGLHWIKYVEERIRQGIASQTSYTHSYSEYPPKFTLQTERIAFGNGTKRIVIECLAVAISQSNAFTLKRRISTLYYNERTMPGMCAPSLPILRRSQKLKRKFFASIKSSCRTSQMCPSLG